MEEDEHRFRQQQMMREFISGIGFYGWTREEYNRIYWQRKIDFELHDTQQRTLEAILVEAADRRAFNSSTSKRTWIFFFFDLFYISFFLYHPHHLIAMLSSSSPSSHLLPPARGQARVRYGLDDPFTAESRIRDRSTNLLRMYNDRENEIDQDIGAEEAFASHADSTWRKREKRLWSFFCVVIGSRFRVTLCFF